MAPHRGQSGNGTILVIFGLFALGIAGGIYFLLSGGRTGDSDKLAQAARAAYDDAVARLDKALTDRRSFDVSLDHNAATFQCLYSSDGNCHGQGGAFLLFDGQGQHPLSELAKDAGMDPYGNPCRGFPSKDCPLRIETDWEPVCNGTTCDSTRSARVKGSVTLAPMTDGGTPLEWSKDALFTPQIQLSQSAQCARGGGEWTGSDCLSPAQAAERRMPAAAQNAATAPATAQPATDVPQPVPQQTFECPPQIVVQGQFYPVQYLSQERGQVTVPAMSCQVQGAVDVFVFQCMAKNPPTFPGEGQWIQVEAVMAPACDANGNPAGNLPVKF